MASQKITFNNVLAEKMQGMYTSSKVLKYLEFFHHYIALQPALLKLERVRYKLLTINAN